MWHKGTLVTNERAAAGSQSSEPQGEYRESGLPLLAHSIRLDNGFAAHARSFQPKSQRLGTATVSSLGGPGFASSIQLETPNATVLFTAGSLRVLRVSPCVLFLCRCKVNQYSNTSLTEIECVSCAEDTELYLG